MKKILSLVLSVLLLAMLSGQVLAVNFIDGDPPLTQHDKDVATAFIGGLKWDLTQGTKGIVSVTLPKLNANEYTVGIMDSRIDDDGATFKGKEDYQGSGGKKIDIKLIDTNGRTRFKFTMGSFMTGRAVFSEVFIYTPGAKQIEHPDPKTYVEPVKDKDGNIIFWVDMGGTVVKMPDSTPTDDRKFKDVGPTHWAYQVINTLFDSGYIKGYPDGIFKPDGPITRAEYAVMLRNVLKDRYPGGKLYSHTNITNIPANFWGFPAINELFTYMPEEDIKAIFGTNFEPNKPITREEVVAVLASTLANNNKFISAGSTALTDLNTSKFPDAVNFSAANNLVVGYPDNTFKPQNDITRAEIAAVMVKLLGKL